MIADDGLRMLTLMLRMRRVGIAVTVELTSKAVMHSSAMARAFSRFSSILRQKNKDERRAVNVVMSNMQGRGGHLSNVDHFFVR